MAIHRADQKLRLTIRERRHALLSGHKLFDHVLSPRTLCLIKNGNAFGRDIIVANERIAVLMDNLNKRGSAAQSICFRDTVTTLLFLLYLITGKSFLQHCHQREVTGQEHSMFALLRIGTLDCNIQSNQRFTGTRHTCHKADGFSAICLAMLDNAVDLIGGNRQVFCTSIATGNIVDVVSAIQRLRRLHDRRGREILRVLSCLIVECRFIVTCCHGTDHISDIIRVTTERLDYAIAFAYRI